MSLPTSTLPKFKPEDYQPSKFAGDYLPTPKGTTDETRYERFKRCVEIIVERVHHFFASIANLATSTARCFKARIITLVYRVDRP